MNTNTGKTENPDAKLSFFERVAYGIGDYAGNLVYSSISAFLLVYYISVLGVDAGVAASIMAVSKIFDGVSDLIMGRIVDKTKSKWGKARPWILRMSIPLAVCTVLMFSVPASLAGSAQVAYMFLTYNLVSTIFYTGLNVPYASLQGLMTTNQYERGLLGNFRMLLATFGTMTVNTVVLKMCAFFGGGEQYSQKGWTLAFVCLMIAFVVLNLITFFFCKERVVDTENADGARQEKGPSVIECLKSLVVNKYWLLMVIFLFSLYFMMSTFFGSAYYFAQYVLGDESAYAITANSLSTLAGQSVTLVVACNILKGAAFGCGAATMFGLLQDAITYGQWLTGVQAVGMGNAASSFCMKVGSGIGTAALGWILDAGSFTADPTSASAIASVNVACIWVPVITCVIGAVCLLAFDLDKHYKKAVDDLAAGKWRGSL